MSYTYAFGNNPTVSKAYILHNIALRCLRTQKSFIPIGFPALSKTRRAFRKRPPGNVLCLMVAWIKNAEICKLDADIKITHKRKPKHAISTHNARELHVNFLHSDLAARQKILVEAFRLTLCFLKGLNLPQVRRKSIAANAKIPYHLRSFMPQCRLMFVFHILKQFCAKMQVSWKFYEPGWPSKSIVLNATTTRQRSLQQTMLG